MRHDRIPIRGTRYYSAKHLFFSNALTEGASVTLVHQPDNPYDSNAVAVVLEGTGKMLGHIPRELAPRLVNLLTSGVHIESNVANVSRNGDFINIDILVAHDGIAALPVAAKPFSAFGKKTGFEKALEHIQEAEKLTRELGGTDQDVKNYFFSLPSIELKKILNKYELAHGSAAREYAEKTFPSWKSGKVHMSGMVAERLFNLLPPVMPIEAKFQLTESLWKHVGPSSNKKFSVGVDVNLGDISNRVKSHLEEVVTHYQIPSSMEARFNWLSQGDVAVKQQLLNHFRQQEKALLSEALRTQLPVLIDHLNSEKGSLTTHAAQVLKVGKHEVQVVVTDGVNGVSETAPVRIQESSDYSWIWWVVGIIFVLWLLSK